MARSRLPFSVFSGGASSSARAWPSPRAGVLPSFPSALGRLTPRTGLWLTALTSQRWSNREATAASLRRMELGAKPRRSKSFRQAMRWARVTCRISSGLVTPAKAVNSFTSWRYARRVRGLSRLANHSSSGGISPSPWNSARLKRLPSGSNATPRECPFWGSCHFQNYLGSWPLLVKPACAPAFFGDGAPFLLVTRSRQAPASACFHQKWPRIHLR
jgi:hypothetical protein